MEVDRPQKDCDVMRDPRKLAGEAEAEAAQAAATPNGAAVETASSAGGKAQGVQTNRQRCFSCNKKVGLTGGLACRCGFVYCSKHRYPEEHACDFNFKSSERERLAKTVTGGGQFTKVERI